MLENKEFLSLKKKTLMEIALLKLFMKRQRLYLSPAVKAFLHSDYWLYLVYF